MPPIGLAVIARWTAVLALAWLGHGMLARRNPRWRVALWRTTVAGIALVAVLSAVPPFMTYHLLPGHQAPAKVNQLLEDAG
jgi:hypothetical protein